MDKLKDILTSKLIGTVLVILTSIFLGLSGLTTYFVYKSYDKMDNMDTKLGNMQSMYFELKLSSLEDNNINSIMHTSMLDSITSNSKYLRAINDSIYKHSSEISLNKKEIKKVKESIGLF